MSEATVEIVEYESQYRDDFARLNRQWLDKYFTVEPIDEEYFANPEEKILAKGGAIYMALLNGEVAGTCALIKHGGNVELAKMGVDENIRGRGIGRKLLEVAIEKALAVKPERFYLETNSKLKPAIHLYESMGFTTTEKCPESEYARCDLLMDYPLK